MHAVFVRLLAATFAVGLLSVGSGCIVRTSGHGHVRSQRHGSHNHCHYKGGKHRKQVCHSHPHDASHH